MACTTGSWANLAVSKLKLATLISLMVRLLHIYIANILEVASYNVQSITKVQCHLQLLTYYVRHQFHVMWCFSCNKGHCFYMKYFQLASYTYIHPIASQLYIHPIASYSYVLRCYFILTFINYIPISYKCKHKMVLCKNKCMHKQCML